MALPRPLQTVLVTQRGDRLRFPWRLLLGILVLTVVSLAVVIPLSLVVPEFLLDPDPGVEVLTVTSVLSIPTLLIALWVIAKFIDRRPYTDYGLGIDRRWVTDLGVGMIIGAMLPTGMFVVGVLFGWISVVEIATLDLVLLETLVLVTVLFIAVGIVEELLIRGWLLPNVAEGFAWLGREEGVVVSIILTSILFGVLHLANPGATIAAALIISLAGIFLALGFVYTGELGLPIGIHITWNLFLGGVYGFPVSGLSLPVTPIRIELVGPTVITGGAFGPEAGLLGVVAILTGIWLLYWWVRWYHGGADIVLRLGKPPR